LLILEFKIFNLKSTICNLSFYYFAAAQAGSADADSLSDAVYLRANWAKVDVPAPPADIVRVTDSVSKLRPLAANITNVCHDCSPVRMV
jgi:hypothetical protein